MRSTLFLNDVTILDHAILDADGIIRGGSFSPQFEITGEVIGDEAVVVDFSALKKKVKEIIDNRKHGFDHKLIVPTSQFHNCEISPEEFVLRNRHAALKIPMNAVRFVNSAQADKESLQEEIRAHVERMLGLEYPDIKVSVRCHLSEKFEYLPRSGQSELEQPMAIGFRYTHGLKNSSSWGCQNLAHGHLSFMQLLPASDGSSSICPITTLNVLRELQDTYDNAVFIMRENIVGEDDQFVRVSYTTERGTFRGTYNRQSYNLHILETETTIEHLVSAVAERFGSRIKEAGYAGLAISEGLTKGALIEL